MAVQAQYPATAISPDFRNRARSSPLDELQVMQDPRNLLQLHASNPLLLVGKQQQQQLLNNNATVFSDRQSGLTCNASGSRKRTRDESMPLAGQNNAAVSPLLGFGSALGANSVVAGCSASGLLSQSRLQESGTTSTSGRQVSSSALDLVSVLYQHNLEVDAFVRLQNERLRVGLEEARKRHCRSLLSVLEQQVANRLMEKEVELQSASRRNAELEGKVRQMSEENQMWFNMAKSNEAMVCSLRTSLEQALLQGACGGASLGFDDGQGVEAPFPAEDAQSCCYEVDDPAAASAPADSARSRKACKACGERDVCVLLLPCRHLCLCKECEGNSGECPICGAIKNACLQVFMC